MRWMKSTKGCGSGHVERVAESSELLHAAPDAGFGQRSDLKQRFRQIRRASEVFTTWTLYADSGYDSGERHRHRREDRGTMGRDPPVVGSGAARSGGGTGG